jgi:hypothetical protein
MGGCLMAMLLTFSTGGQLISLIIPGSPTAPFFFIDDCCLVHGLEEETMAILGRL